MPNPKPRTHLLCSLCKKREKANSGLCIPCRAYYEAALETMDIAQILPIIVEDKRRQREVIFWQEVADDIAHGKAIGEL